MSRRRIPPPTWKVEVERHIVGRRYLIPAERMRLSAVSETDAREYGVRLVYARLEVIPPWKPLRRESLEHTTATRIGDPKPATIYPPAHCQERLAA